MTIHTINPLEKRNNKRCDSIKFLNPPTKSNVNNENEIPTTKSNFTKFMGSKFEEGETASEVSGPKIKSKNWTLLLIARLLISHSLLEYWN
jgi:hypothetical protein